MLSLLNRTTGYLILNISYEISNYTYMKLGLNIKILFLHRNKLKPPFYV
jgi:hypothetical protein